MNKREIIAIGILICVLGWGFYLMYQVVDEVVYQPLQNISKSDANPIPNNPQSSIESHSNEVEIKEQPTVNKNVSEPIIIKNVSNVKGDNYG